MTRLTKLAMTGAALAVFAPLSVQSPAVADGEGLFRLNEACGQADGCVSAQRYICSTHHGDYKDYKPVPKETEVTVTPVEGETVVGSTTS